MLLRTLGQAVVLVAVVAFRVEAGSPATGYEETDVVTGLALPTALAFLPDGRMLVTQQGGELVLVDGGKAATVATLPVCFPDLPIEDGFETGLLGVAVHPDFPTDRSIFLYRTRTVGAEPCDQNDLFANEMRNEVVRVTLAADDTVDLGGLTTLITDIGAETGYHNGGALRVGPHDDKLYVSVGDSGVGDPSGPPGSSFNPYAQELGSLNGKILRLELDGSPPADNPFVATIGARPEVWARGFRNPFRMGFDPQTNALWVGDVGEDTVEEIDLVAAGSNHGWPRCEGTLPVGCEQAGDVAPVFSYPHEGTGALGDTVIGGAFPQGGALASLADHYVFADFEVDPPYGDISALALDGTRTGVTGQPVTIVENGDGAVDLVIGPDGALYYVSFLAGAVRRVADAGAVACDTIATCQAALDAVLPDPDAAPDKKQRKVAKKLGKLDTKSDRKLAKAATAAEPKQARFYGKARKTLEKLLTAARTADEKGTLPVSLAVLEAAVNALLATIPASS